MQKFNITQIFSNEITKPVEKQNYLVGIINKKNTNYVMKFLAAYPIAWHLKRVKPLKQGQNNEIALCKCSEIDNIDKIKECVYLIETKVLGLPKQQCYLKQQFSKWQEIWPCIFKNEVQVIKHSQQEKQFIKKLIGNNNICLFSKQRKILMNIEGQCKKNSVLHGVMRLLQQWPLTQEYNSQLQINNQKLSQLQKIELKTMSKYYYLTGLYLLIQGQICSMCTMALVHSRLQRLYITIDVVQPIKSICYQKKLNHNYHLFKL